MLVTYYMWVLELELQLLPVLCVHQALRKAYTGISDAIKNAIFLAVHISYYVNYS